MASANKIAEGKFVSFTREYNNQTNTHDISLNLDAVFTGPRGDHNQSIVLSNTRDAAALADHFNPGDQLYAYTDEHGNAAVVNETTHSVSRADGKGQYHTEKLERSGRVSEVQAGHGSHAGTLAVGGHPVNLGHGKDAEAVLAGIKKGDDLQVYTDPKGHPVIYNETQHTVSRQDGHGHFATEPLPSLTASGTLTQIERDKKDPNKVTLHYLDEFGTEQLQTMNDTPTQRIDKQLKPGDVIDLSVKDTGPGRADISIKDRTRPVEYNMNHNGVHTGFAVLEERAKTVNGVTQQHDGGKTLAMAPGSKFTGQIAGVHETHGVVTIDYADVKGHIHSINVESHPKGPDGKPGHNSLAPAALEKLHPGDSFQLQFKADGTYQLNNGRTHEVITPGKGDHFNVDPPKQVEPAGRAYTR